jgi:hypothetical protein
MERWAIASAMALGVCACTTTNVTNVFVVDGGEDQDGAVGIGHDSGADSHVETDSGELVDAGGDVALDATPDVSSDAGPACPDPSLHPVSSQCQKAGSCDAGCSHATRYACPLNTQPDDAGVCSNDGTGFGTTYECCAR